VQLELAFRLLNSGIRNLIIRKILPNFGGSSCLHLHFQMQACADHSTEIGKNARKSNFFSVSALANVSMFYRYISLYPSRSVNFENRGINSFSPLRWKRLKLNRFSWNWIDFHETHFPSTHFVNESDTEFHESQMKNLVFWYVNRQT
jgi:hypothetical protein